MNRSNRVFVGEVNAKSEAHESKIVTKFRTYPLYDRESAMVEFKKQMSALECPFTWNLDELYSSSCTKQYDLMHGDVSYQILPSISAFKIMLEVLEMCQRGKLDISCQLGMFNGLEALAVCTAKTNELEGLTLKAIKHIIQSTKCHALANAHKEDEARILLKTISDKKEMNSKDKNTILGCQAFVWLVFRNKSAKGENLIRLAINGNPDNVIWHFILGKHLRRARIARCMHEQPSEEEKNCFQTVYDKSPSFMLRLYAAEMFCEYDEKEKAFEMCKDLFIKGRHTGYFVAETYVRLALSFTLCDAKSWAEKCFNFGKVTFGTNVRFLHFRGIFYRRFRQYEKAVKYLEKAIAANNCMAIEDYCICKLKINKKFNVIQYLLALLSKFETMGIDPKQRAYLHIGLEYHNQSNLPEALKYFHKALVADHTSLVLRDFSTLRDPNRSLNIFEYFARNLFPDVDRRRKSLNQTSIHIYKDLIHLCNDVYNMYS